MPRGAKMLGKPLNVAKMACCWITWISLLPCCCCQERCPLLPRNDVLVWCQDVPCCCLVVCQVVSCCLVERCPLLLGRKMSLVALSFDAKTHVVGFALLFDAKTPHVVALLLDHLDFLVAALLDVPCWFWWQKTKTGLS